MRWNNREPSTHTFKISQRGAFLEQIHTPIGMFMKGWIKLENPKETHSHRETPYREKPEVRIELGSLELVPTGSQQIFIQICSNSECVCVTVWTGAGGFSYES